MDVENGYFAERGRRVEPGEAFGAGGDAEHGVVGFFVGQLTLELEVEPDQVHPHGLPGLRGRGPRVLRGVGVDGEPVDGGVERVIFVFAREHLAVDGPAPRRGPKIAVRRAVGLRDGRAATEARDRSCCHAGDLSSGTTFALPWSSRRITSK